MLPLLGLLPLAAEVTVSIGELIAGGAALVSGTAIVGKLAKEKENKKEKIETDIKCFIDCVSAYCDVKNRNFDTLKKNSHNIERIIKLLVINSKYKNEIENILIEEDDEYSDYLEYLNKANSIDDFYLYLYEAIEENEKLIHEIKASKIFDIDLSGFNEEQRNTVFKIKKNYRNFNDEFCKKANMMKEINENFKNIIKILREE